MFTFLKKYILQFFRVYCREFKLILGDPGILLFLLFLPLGYPIVYSLIYNPEVVRDVKMVVVDHDRTSLSREMTRNIDATQEAWVIGYATDLAEARHAMNSHKCYAIMEIPEGFERNVRNGVQANATIYCEASLLLRYRGFLMAATNVSQAMGAEIMEEKIDLIAPLVTTITDGDLMPIENIAMGNIESGFDSFIMPGVLILILQQCIILALGMSGGAKRERPSLIGYDGVNEEPSVLMTMAGQMLCYITILILPIIFLTHYVSLIFSFPMAGNYLEIIAFILPMVIASAALGFCLQGVIWERESVFVLWVVTSVVFLFLSGLTWPRYAMSPFWKFISDAVPATWGVEGFIRMNTNGARLAQEAHDYHMLWILAIIYTACAYCVQRWVVRPSIKRGYFSYAKVRELES